MIDKHIDMLAQPLLSYQPDTASHGPLFGAPPKCSPRARATVDTLNGIHHSWERQQLFTVDTRLTGLPSPLSIINTPKERKSPNAIANYARRRCNAPPSAKQAQKRSATRLLRDAMLATMRYYSLDPHAFDIPTDADILTWSPGKVRARLYAARDGLFAQILLREMPEATEGAARARPQLALRVGIVPDEGALEDSQQECYVAFTKPKPFWRRMGEPLFCVPIMASGSHSACLFAASADLPRTFSQRGRMRFQRVGTGEFLAQPNQVGQGGTSFE